VHQLVQQTAIKTKTSKSRLENRVNLAIAKCKSQGLNLAASFLETKARRSSRTALVFSAALVHLNEYAKSAYHMDLEHIVAAIKRQKVDVYMMLNGFVTYLQKQTPNGSDMMTRTVISYMAAAKSFLGYVDVDISPKKFGYRVSMPTLYREDEAAMDANDVREILNHCDNRRLKAYLLVLASGGMRAIEALAIREQDIDWNGINFADLADMSEPAGVKIRKEYAKTRRERHIFISNEAARYLNNWLQWKYKDESAGTRQASKHELVFMTRPGAQGQHPAGLYNKLHIPFRRVLTLAQRGSRKEEGIVKRGLVTFHSFRRFVKTTIANQTRNDAYAEWFIGHAKSPYYTNKPDKLKSIYKDDCMKFLTFLDYPTIESLGRSLDSKLKEVQRENELLKAQLRHMEVTKESELQQLKQQVSEYNDSRSAFISQVHSQIEAFQRDVLQLKEQIEAKDYKKHVPTEDELKYEADIHELLSNPKYDHSLSSRSRRRARLD
jgi:integrase